MPRSINRPAVEAKLAATFSTLDRAAARSRLVAANTAFGFVNDFPALAAHPALRRIVVETQCGPARIACPPVSAAGETMSLGPVPSIGEYTDVVRADFARSASSAAADGGAGREPGRGSAVSG